MSQNSLDFALAQHSERHGEDGDDPITPQMIGAEPLGAALAAAEAAASAIADAVAGLAPFNDDGDVLDENANVLARADLSNVDIDTTIGPSISAAVAALIAGAPGALDTLNELAAALGDDQNFAATVATALAAKAPLVSPALSGAPTINGHTPVTADQGGSVFVAPNTVVVRVKDFGAVADGMAAFDGAISSGSHNFTSAKGRFTSAHVGKTIGVQGAGAPVATALTTALTTTAITTRLAVTALTAAVPAGLLTLTSGGNTQQVLVAAAAVGATSLTIRATAATFAFPIGTTVSIPTALVTTISAYTSATAVTLTAAATTAVSGAYYASGTDNTTAFQNAINAARGTVLVDSGSYLTRELSAPSELTMMGPNGSGFDSANYYSGRSAELILAPAANSSIIESAGFLGRFVNLLNLKLSGSSALQTVAAPAVNIPDQGSGDEWDWTIDNCFIADSSGDGILIGGLTRGTVVRDTWCYANFGNGVTVNGTDNVLDGVKVGANIGYGIAGFGTANTVHGGCNIWANAAGVFLGATFGWQINDNYIDSNRAGGVYISDGRSHTIVGNKFTSQSAAGFGGAATITLDNGTSEILIAGNLMWQQNAGPHSSYGILVNAGCSWYDGGNLITSITYSVAAIGGAGATNYDTAGSPVTGVQAAKVGAGAVGLLDASDPMAIGDGIACPLVAANYYGAQGTGTTAFILSAGTMRGGLLVAGRKCTIVEIGLEITVAGSSGAVVRLGLYKVAAGASLATAKLVDAGTIDGTVVGYAGLTISQALNIGDKLILVAACQGAPTTGPTVRGMTGNVPYFGNSVALTASQNAFCGTAATGVTGALPSSHTISGTPTIPRVLVKAS